MPKPDHAPRATLRPGIRQAKICELVARRGAASVEDMAERFHASPETIRRDLSALAEAGRLRKVHGGARALGPLEEGVLSARMRQNLLAKQLIAEKAARLVAPGMVLFVDTGSTTLIAARELARIRRLTIITNSTQIADIFATGAGGGEVILLGGRYRHDNAQVVGAEAIAQAGLYSADMALLTIGALDSGGAMDFSSHEAQLARAMIANAQECTLLADHSKLNKRAGFRVCTLDQVTNLVSDRPPQESLKEALKKNRVALG